MRVEYGVSMEMPRFGVKLCCGSANNSQLVSCSEFEQCLYLFCKKMQVVVRKIFFNIILEYQTVFYSPANYSLDDTFMQTNI